MSLLSIQNLHISAGDREIVHGLSLEIKEGEVHAIMGPNGSGKSTLVNALMGHPAYQITKGSVTFKGEDLLSMPTHERARKGLFLAFQYPKEISGVTVRSFLLAAMKAKLPEGGHLSPIDFSKQLTAEMKELSISPDFAERSLNKGFSGGEKKKSEILQLRLLKPALALLDETDSGLDVDALKIVGHGVEAMRIDTSMAGNIQMSFSALVVTHYARILQYLKPDTVHVMIRGELKESGGMELAELIEKDGYAKYGVATKIGLETE